MLRVRLSDESCMESIDWPNFVMILATTGVIAMLLLAFLANSSQALARVMLLERCRLEAARIRDDDATNTPAPEPDPVEA